MTTPTPAPEATMSPEEVARKLTPLQFQALTKFPESQPTLPYGFAIANLIRLGLLDYAPKWFGVFGDCQLSITRKGRRVSTILKGQS